MMKSNYHTHTYRCGHAVGTEKEMVEAAIKSNIQELGFSEHVPLPKYRKHLLYSLLHIRSIKSLLTLFKAFITDGLNMRMPYKYLDDYLQQLSICQNEYKEQISIYRGFEAEGFEEYFDYYQSLLDTNRIDYLILGHHFDKYCIHNKYFGRNKMGKKDIYQYCNDVEKALETKMFSYLAHPDLFLIGYKEFDIDAQTVTKRICEKAKELDIPLEINAGGIRRGYVNRNGEDIYLYPNKNFWKIASQVGNDVIFGIDAHNPNDFNKSMYRQLEDFANEYQLHVIDELVFLKGK